jgi:hypothetical protein
MFGGEWTSALGDDFIDRLLERPSLEPVELAEIADMLARGEAGVEADRIRKPARPPLGLLAAPLDGDAVDEGAAAVGLQQAHQHVERGRLARAVGAEQSGDGAVGGFEACSVDRLDGAEFLREIPYFDHRSSAFTLWDPAGTP